VGAAGRAAAPNIGSDLCSSDNNAMLRTRTAVPRLG
jgi:hypothetical protein